MCDFSFKHYEQCLVKALELNYNFVTCYEYIKNTKLDKDFYNGKKTIINRVDLDYCCKRAKKISSIFDELNIAGTFFVRLHADYNPYSFENYLCLKDISKNHEIGYHSEIIDCSKIWNEETESILIKDIKILNEMLDIKINGIASHGGITSYNNLDFWKKYDPSKFNLEYEAYDSILFDKSFYISLLLLTGWKCYDKGILVKDDKRCFCEHLDQGHELIYCNTHPIKLYERHPYE